MTRPTKEEVAGAVERLTAIIAELAARAQAAERSLGEALGHVEELLAMIHAETTTAARECATVERAQVFLDARPSPSDTGVK